MLSELANRKSGCQSLIETKQEAKEVIPGVSKALTVSTDGVVVKPENASRSVRDET